MGLFSLGQRLRDGADKLNIIPYLNYVLYGQVYGKLITSKSGTSYLTGYYDSFLDKQKNKPSQDSGTPWASSTISLIKTNNAKEL